MHRRNPSNDASNRAPPPVSYGAGPNLQHLTHRIIKAKTHPVNVSILGAPPPPYKRKRESTFAKNVEMPMRNVPLHINTQMNSQFSKYMKPTQQIKGNINEMGSFATTFNNPHVRESRGFMFRPKEPPSPMMAPAQMVYEKMLPFKSSENLVPFPKAGPPSPLPKGKQGHSKLPKKNILNRQNAQFKLKLERLNSALEQVNKVCDKVKFAVVSIFRVRVGYRLEEFEQYYLHNVERVYRYLLFLFVLNGYKESLSFSTSSQSKEDLSWETGKFLKFVNEEKDLALVAKTILTTGPINTNPSTNGGSNSGIGETGKNREGRGSVNDETSVDNYKVIRWDSEPAVTYTFNNPPPTISSKRKDDMVVLIRTVNLNTITSNMLVLKYLSYMYRNTNESVLNMLGHYSLICADEDYIIIISSILPSLEEQQLRTFYESLATLLDVSRCNLQLYYLERFIERFMPICFSQESSCWRPVVNNIAMVISPLKLTNKKYMNCCISLVRTLKSFCDKFVECKRTTFNVFLMSLKLLLQSSDDSRILIRGESTDLLIQIWLNPRGKEIILRCMNYDLIKILGLLSGVQSIKLNIWTYLLSSASTASVSGTSSTSNSAQTGSETNSSSGVANTSGTDTRDNVLNLLLKNSKRDSTALFNLVSHKECIYIFNLLLYLEKSNTDLSLMSKGIVGMPMEKEDLEHLENEMALKRGIGLYWYLIKYLRVSKSLLQYEKLSLVVRLSYKLLKHYLYYKSVETLVEEAKDELSKNLRDENALTVVSQDGLDEEINGSFTNNNPLLKLYKAFIKKLDKTTSLGVLFEHLLVLLINNINSSVSCLELANFKLSMVMDMLMFDYSFNSGLLDRNTKEKNYVKINDNSYLNLTKLTSKNSLRILSNLYSKLESNKEFGTDYGNEEDCGANKMADSRQDHDDSNSGCAQEGEENDALECLLGNKLISLVFMNGNKTRSHGDRSRAPNVQNKNANTENMATSDSSGSYEDLDDLNGSKSSFDRRNYINYSSFKEKLLNEKSVLDALLNVSLLTHFINRNVDILRMLMNYLENMVYHYSSELTSTFCINVTSALAMTTILHYMAKREDMETRRTTDTMSSEVNNKKIKELKDSLKKSYLHKLLTLYNISNLDVQQRLIRHKFGDEKYIYVKFAVDREQYESLTRFMLTQAYVLVLEFLYNYAFYEENARRGCTAVIGMTTPEAADGSTISATDMLLKCLTDHKLLEYIDRIVNEDYGLPNYYLSHPSCTMDQGESLSSEPEDKSDNTSGASTTDVANVTYNFTFTQLRTASSSYTRGIEGLNCKLGSVIDMLISSMLYNELHENNELETREMIENKMLKLLGSAYNNGENGKIIAYELMYYITMTSLFNSMFGSSTQLEMGRKLIISMRIFNKLMAHLSKVNDTTPQSVFKGSMRAVFRLRLSNKGERGTMYYGKSVNECSDQVGSSTRAVDIDVNTDGVDNHEAVEHLNYTPHSGNPVEFGYGYVANSGPEAESGHTAGATETRDEDTIEESSDAELIKLVFETVMSDSFLWKSFKKYPTILTCLIKISPISSLLKFFSTFPELHLTYSISYYNTLKNASNNSLFDLLADVNYFLAVLGRDLLEVIGTKGGIGNSGVNNSQLGHVEPQTKSVRRNERLNNNLANADSRALDGENGSLPSSVNVEWFRFYFMYVQLLVRIYEMKHLGSEAVNLERNFYRNFTMPLVNFEHLSEFEYLSKDVILYLLNFKQITNDNNIVCYIGSSDNKSLFVYYMKGYNLSHAPTSSRTTHGAKYGGANGTLSAQRDGAYDPAGVPEEIGELDAEDEQVGDELGMFLYLLTKLSLVNNIRILQVIAFSVFPILVHTVPNKSTFDAVYDALLNIRPRVNSFTFIKYMLLTVIFNWYHKYFFTYNFFIYQYNNSRTINNKLVEKYVDKYLNGENVEFNFNFTFVKIPLQHIHQLQSLF
ncbi:hypothetical protein MACJ_001915 [Theileria orientalis]|uniref:Uncharacterized protein n=1 Tax=Theileria orientalis TaxID=68886 RepID=A0A976M7M7_THEOR|nr:hypothetical protein MACJ_001915 [Theileria orientalis]